MRNQIERQGILKIIHWTDGIWFYKHKMNIIYFCTFQNINCKCFIQLSKVAFWFKAVFKVKSFFAPEMDRKYHLNMLFLKDFTSKF